MALRGGSCRLLARVDAQRSCTTWRAGRLPYRFLAPRQEVLYRPYPRRREPQGNAVDGTNSRLGRALGLLLVMEHTFGAVPGRLETSRKVACTRVLFWRSRSEPRRAALSQRTRLPGSSTSARTACPGTQPARFPLPLDASCDAVDTEPGF